MKNLWSWGQGEVYFERASIMPLIPGVFFHTSQKYLPILHLDWILLLDYIWTGSSQPWDQTQVSYMAGGFFTADPLGKPSDDIVFSKIEDQAYLTKVIKGFPSGSVVKNPPAVQEPQKTWVWSLGWEDHLEEGMATHSSIPAWKIPWTEKPCELQSGISKSWTW